MLLVTTYSFLLICYVESINVYSYVEIISALKKTTPEKKMK